MIKNKQKIAGFTLIELLVVIVIVGILATISVATFQGYFEKARLAKARHAAKQIEQLFLAQNSATEENLFTAWYSFDFLGDVNQTSPFVIDRSEAGNDLELMGGIGGIIAQDSETGIGAGKSLKIQKKTLRRSLDGYTPNGPDHKITIALWLKYERDLTKNLSIFYLLHSTGITLKQDGTITYFMNDGDDKINSSPKALEKNKWYHVIASYNGDQKKMRLWIDGDLVATKDNITQTEAFKGRGIFLGNSDFYGKFDEIMFFPYAFGGEKLN